MELNKSNPAFLVMDMQSTIVGRLPDTVNLLNNVKKAIAIAREKEIPVIYVVVGFRPGAPEISTNNKFLAATKSNMANINMDDMIKIHPELVPGSGEVTVIKRRVSAFSGSDLEVVLRAFSVNHLILAGISTSGVVLSTVREAADKDFRLTILSDCCADVDEEVHRILMTKVFPRQADIHTVNEFEGL